MKNIYFILMAIFFLSGVNISLGVTTGQSAPDFSLPDPQGENHSLTDYRGKYVVLEWLNHDCPFVRKHYDSGNMQNLQKTYTAKDIVWLSLNSSAPGKQGHFSPDTCIELTKKKGASPTLILLDPDGKVGKLYSAQTTPHMYVINPEGKLIYQGAIDNTSSVDPDDIPKSKNYVRAALDEALNGKSVTESTTKSYGCSVKY